MPHTITLTLTSQGARGPCRNQPAKPSEAQWTTLSNAAELCYFETTATGTSWSATYPQNVYGISLFVISR